MDICIEYNFRGMWCMYMKYCSVMQGYVMHVCMRVSVYVYVMYVYNVMQCYVMVWDVVQCGACMCVCVYVWV